MDYYWEIPIFTFKVFVAGIDSFFFNSNFKIIALGCQDDSALLINLDCFNYLRIIGHKSFISRVIYHEYSKDIFRLVISSMDSFISITDFNTDLIYPKEKCFRKYFYFRIN